ncbi:MFS transporter [Variovorax sp. 22077]|uniref:MFS transporter n=1 Tax=Variovorax sp. 22077 TaxID=3453867 RepID=UPI003F875E2E
MKNLDAAALADATSSLAPLSSSPSSSSSSSSSSLSSAHGLPAQGAGTRDATRRTILAAVIGNTLEWFDFAVYGFFALTISRLFFPTGDETSSLLLTVATFGVGFVMRPVGAVVLGALGDSRGRKVALSTTILLMALGTAMIGFAPTYADVGLWAPAWIVLARLIQGFSAGGEVGGATAFLVEHAPKGRRGYFASWQQASQAGALLLGSVFGATLTDVLTPEQLEAWGWRVPFLFGLVIGPVGWYIRTRTHESESFEQVRAANRQTSPLKQALGSYRREIIAGFGVTIVWTVCTYFFLVYMPTYAVRTLKLPQSVSLWANGAGLMVLVVLAPFFGALSDRIGRRPLLIGFATAILVLAYPALWLLTAVPNPSTLTIVLLVFAVLIAGFTGPAPAAMAELYPPQVRSTGLSIAYNFAVTIFGGFAPFIATALIARTGNPLAPAWYVVFAAAASLVALLAAGSALRNKD